MYQIQVYIRSSIGQAVQIQLNMISSREIICQIIQQQFNIEKQKLILYYDGKIIEDQVKLKSNTIIHFIDSTKIVKDNINIMCKRIYCKSINYQQISVNSEIAVQELLNQIRSKLIGNKQEDNLSRNVFLVHVGRQLKNNLSLYQNGVEDGAEIFCIDEIVNVEKQTNYEQTKSIVIDNVEKDVNNEDINANVFRKKYVQMPPIQNLNGNHSIQGSNQNYLDKNNNNNICNLVDSQTLNENSNYDLLLQSKKQHNLSKIYSGEFMKISKGNESAQIKQQQKQQQQENEKKKLFSFGKIKSNNYNNSSIQQISSLPENSQMEDINHLNYNNINQNINHNNGIIQEYLQKDDDNPDLDQLLS